MRLPKVDSMSKLAHDLRGTVAAILMWEQIARLGGPEVRDDALAAIRASALDQAKLIDQLVRTPAKRR
jgi:hypothetical protein